MWPIGCHVARKAAISLQICWWTDPSPAAPEQTASVRGRTCASMKISKVALVMLGGGGGARAGS